MDRWVGALGASLALVGTLVLGFELWRSRKSEADTASFRADQDRVEKEVREAVVRLRGAMAGLAKLFFLYLRDLELERKQAREGIAHPDQELLDDSRAFVLKKFDEARKQLESSVDEERALAVISDIGRRTEERFAKQAAEAKRLRIVSALGVILVAVGTVFQLVDVLSRP